MGAGFVSDRQLQVIGDALLAIGYEERAIVSNYEFAVPNGHTTLERADLVAFADHARHDLQTSCIAVNKLSATDADGVSRKLNRLSFLAVPLAVMANEDAVEVWPVKPTGRVQRIERLPYGRVMEFFTSHERDLGPESVVAAKNKGIQLSFFDIDPQLLEFAYEATQKILVQQFEIAVHQGRHALRQSPRNDQEFTAPLTSLALQVLAAAILEDKRIFGDDKRSTSARELLSRAEQEYGAYFCSQDINRVGEQAADLLHHFLRRNVTFRSFTNEMLGYFYENTFVSEKLRGELGIYYTPRSIARRMLARLPVEDIPPHKRTVLDGTCGSGSLLLAAYERLANLLPSEQTVEQRHRYFVKHIHGVDKDPFAAQVSRLSLFLFDFPSGDAWDVQAADFLKVKQKQAAYKPMVIVGNPPFKEHRSSEGKRLQTATLLLERYLDWLPQEGLLGIVLPETFLENASCRNTRHRLLSECELLDIWQLPEGIFPLSNAATAIILARKSLPKVRSKAHAVRVERVAGGARSRSEFLSNGKPTFSFIWPVQEEWLNSPEARISPSPLDNILWSKLTFNMRLGDIANVRNGIIPGNKDRAELAGEQLSDEWKPWLEGTTPLRPYSVQWPGRFVRYPGRLMWPRSDLETVFATPRAKVLVNANRAPGNPWRLFAAIDDLGLYPAQGLHCIIPKKPGVTLEELVAFLNCPIASAWVDSRNRRRWISEPTLRAMPFPDFTKDHRAMLIDLVERRMEWEKAITGVHMHDVGLAAEVAKLTVEIDHLIFDAFGLPHETRQDLYNFFSGYRRPGTAQTHVAPEAPLSLERAEDGRWWTVTGQVLGIEPKADRVKLWISGYGADEPITVSIPEAMPGWALRSDVAFQANIPWRSRSFEAQDVAEMINFRPLEFSYLSTDGLFEILAHPEEISRIGGFDDEPD